MARSLFIAFEGPDGSGQSTQAELLKNHLALKGLKVLLTKEPTSESEAGLTVIRTLQHQFKYTPHELQFLFAEDRRRHLSDLILPALKNGTSVITDRYLFSSLAFGMLDCDLDWLININKDFPFPDLTIVLTVNPKECIKRIQSRGKPLEFFEEKRKLEEVNSNYRFIWLEKFPDIRLIDGGRTTTEVFGDIRKIVDEALEKNESGP